MPDFNGQVKPQSLHASGWAIGNGTGTSAIIPCTTEVALLTFSSEIKSVTMTKFKLLSCEKLLNAEMFTSIANHRTINLPINLSTNYINLLDMKSTEKVAFVFFFS